MTERNKIKSLIALAATMCALDGGVAISDAVKKDYPSAILFGLFAVFFAWRTHQGLGMLRHWDEVMGKDKHK